jgi:glycosyltransferase involved in cell wall biosynthesis
MRLALVLWAGLLGGAETFSQTLEGHLREQGVETGVLFVGNPGSVGDALGAAGVSYTSLGLIRGADVVLHPRRLARATYELGADGAIVVEPGLLAGALRAGGYRGRVVVVNHGRPLHSATSGVPEKIKSTVLNASGFWAADVEVAVSDAVLNMLRRRLHARRLVRIYNGIDLTIFQPARNQSRDEALVVGWAGRLVPGKGVEDLIAAADVARQRVKLRLRIAGEGPLRPRLEQQARSLGMNGVVGFEGEVVDMASFWRSCDVGTTPSSSLPESFGMSAAEAMACGCPVVASRLGALPEVVADGQTGFLYEPRDIGALASALERYASDESLRLGHAANARALCEERFDIRDCASQYRALFDPAAS